MGTLVLMNDVETNDHVDGLIGGNPHVGLTKAGKLQCTTVPQYLHKKVKRIDVVACSDAPWLITLVHYVRSKAGNKEILRASPQYTESLRERNFGVLIGSRYSLDSDLFKHTRICAEKGESIAQCRRRAMLFVKGICVKFPKKTLLLISHSFTCQIISNVILNKDHTILSEFWLTKGSFVRFNYKAEGAAIHRWKFVDAYNAVSDRSYTEEKLYSRLSET